MPINIAIFASGSGTNAENIFSFFKDKNDIASIKLVLSNKDDAYVLERAKKWNIPSVVFSKKELDNTERIDQILKENQIEFIILSGFLLKIPERITSLYHNRIVNIHPALLPKYGGKGMYGHHVHDAVINANEKESGITIHYANGLYDSGDIILQAHCKVLPTDTAESLATRVHQLEYAYFPITIETLLKKMERLKA